MPTPRRILMLAFPGCQILDVVGPMQMFAGANREQGTGVYDLTIAAPERGPFATNSGMSLVADRAFSEVASGMLDADCTVIAAGGDDGVRIALAAGEVTSLIRAAYAAGARIVSVCSGAFFLAAAGVLDGRRAATHWESVERLRRFRPAVTVDPDSIYVRDGGIWSSAGVTAGIDLALALIEADLGRATALAVAQRHVVFPIRPGGQGQFSPVLAAGAVRDRRLAKLAERVAGEPNRDWHTGRLAEEACVSARSLTRLFRKELNVSPAAFVERVRIDQARRALLDTSAAVETIAIDCGFGSLRRMDRAFGRAIAATPTAFRARFKQQGESSCPSSISAS